MIDLFKDPYRPANYSLTEIRAVLERDKAGKMKRQTVLKARLIKKV